jgi:hypothetical protein
MDAWAVDFAEDIFSFWRRDLSGEGRIVDLKSPKNLKTYVNDAA